MAQHTGATSGGGQAPASNLEYDLLTMLQNKLQAITAYETYLKDAQGNQAVQQIIRDCMEHDRQQALRLRQELAKLLQQGGQAQASRTA